LTHATSGFDGKLALKMIKNGFIHAIFTRFYEQDSWSWRYAVKMEAANLLLNVGQAVAAIGLLALGGILFFDVKANQS
jgi:hypothetical protein